MNAVERLARFVQLPTVSSYSTQDEDANLFASVPDLLAELYPTAHGVLERELIGDRAIVYRWEGAEPSLPPMLGMAHYDVVPPGDEANWNRKPFAAEIDGGRIHGRGTLDDKGMLSAWLEAVDRAAARGEKPKRTLYLAFGGDEETLGTRGAAATAAEFARRGLRFAFILDEGGAVAVDQLAAFTDRPVALVGTAEKGYLTLRITARGMPGHASAPPKRTAIGRLGRAMAVLEDKPFPKRLTDVPAGMFRALGRAVGGLKGFILSHPRLFAPIILKALSANPSTSGMIRTTAAPTIVRGGERDNVLPDAVEGYVNLRILPGESVAGTVARVKRLVASVVDEDVEVEPLAESSFEPVPAGRATPRHWNMFTDLVAKTWPGAVAAPYLMTATTDSRWYRDVTDAIFRFIPMEVTAEDAACVHAANESISTAAWEKSVEFLESIILYDPNEEPS